MTATLRPVPDTPPRAILYLRQSTYKEESISLELQETAGRDYCARMGYTVVRVEQDPGISGRTWKRPAVQRTLQTIEDHEAEVIVLWRWSRLSRSRKDWAIAADKVDLAGGRIESATEPNDVSAAGRFARGIMTELAAFESERIGEQWKEVHHSRITRGKPSGRVPWGWTHQDGQAAPHPENSLVIPRLYEMYIGGMGGRQIAAWLDAHGYKTMYGGTWNYSTVTQILDSPFHTGQITYHGELHPGAHEALISVDTWKRYKALRQERADERAARHHYLLSGILKCACGSPMFGLAHHRSKRGTYFGYRCKTGSFEPDHGPATISIRIIDPAFRDWLRDLGKMEPPEPVEDHAKLDAQRLAREITAIDAQVTALTRQLAQGIVPERAYKATMDDLERSRAGLSTSLEAAEAAIVLQPTHTPEEARELLATWNIVPLQAKRAAIRALVSSMTVDLHAPRTLTITPRGMPPVAIAV